MTYILTKSNSHRDNLQILNVNNTMLLYWAKIPIMIYSHYDFSIIPYRRSADSRLNQAKLWCIDHCKSRWAIRDTIYNDARTLGWVSKSNKYFTAEECKIWREKNGIYMLFKDIREAIIFKLSWSPENI